MPNPKTESIYAVLADTLTALKEPPGLGESQWQKFLRTAAWNHSQSFANQILIYAQRPDATVCQPFDFWTDPKGCNRRIRSGAKGIEIGRASCRERV